MTEVDKKLLNKISSLLKDKNITIAIAESCTGGLISHSFTNIPGSSDFFDRGIVSYSNLSKIQLLNVSKDSLNKYGAVSKQVAKEMAEGIRKKSNVDIGISTTGIAGPTGGTKKKPVGLVFIAVSSKEITIVTKNLFDLDRLGNKISACNTALKMLYEILNGD